MSTKSTLRAVVKATVATLVMAAVSLGQGTLKNGGTFTNNGTATYKQVENANGAAAGTVVNRGTLNTTTAGGGSGDFLNVVTGVAGVVRNYSAAGHGTIVVANNLDNNNASSVFDNDNNAIAGVGILRIAGSITNAGTFDTDTAEVNYNGSGAQSVIATTYGSLKATVGGTKTMAGTVVARDTFAVGTGATFTTSATGDSLALLGTNLSNAGTFSPSLGAVNYGADADQTVFGGTYQRLWLSGSSAARSKTSTSGLSFAASGSLSVGSNDTLVVSGGNLDLATNTPSFTNSSAVKVLADASFHGGITNAGSFYYAGTVAQTIGAVTYDDLRLGGSGAKNFPNATVGILSDYSIDGGTGARDYDAGAASTLAFQGTVGAQTVSNLSGEALNILAFSGAATKSLGGVSFSANRMNVLGTSGAVTNSITGTFTLSNTIGGISMSVASGASFNNGATATITMNGDLENDGTIVNDGTISVY